MKQFKKYNLRLLAATLIILFITACSSDDKFTPKNSTAEFSFVVNDLEVSFTSNSKYAVSLSWDFGDGETSTDINPMHTYAEAGDYTVTLTTVAAVGAESGVTSTTISVALINPTAVFTSEVDDKTVTFTNTSERAVSYSWDFGDGSDVSTEENPVHTYAEDGTYTVTLTTTGVEGSTSATSTETVNTGLNSGGIITIAVENADFQLPASGKQTNWDNVPGWNSDTQASDSGVEEDSENAGEWAGFRMSGDPAVYNLTNHVIVGNEEFKVNLEAWDGWNSSQIIVSLYYDTGDGVRTTLASQTFDFGTIELTATATTESVGAKIGIMIEDNLVTDQAESNGTGWAKFDDVQLSAEVAQIAVFEEVTVENADFQLPASGKQTNWDNVPGWNSDPQAADSGVEEDSENAGEWAGFRMSGDPAVYNLTNHVIADGEEFKVNLEAWDGWNSSQIIVSLYYDTGDGVRTTLASQTFDFGTIELTATATTESVGAKIGIMIEDNLVTDQAESNGTGWAKFDDVQLFAK